jgi:hypothetical protein
MLEHEFAVRQLAALDAIYVAERREVGCPSRPRVSVALDEWDLLASNCERGGVLRARLVRVVRRLVKVLHIGVVAVACDAERPNAEDRDPERLEALAEQRLAALVLPVWHSHGEAILILPVVKPFSRGIEERDRFALLEGLLGVLGLDLLDFRAQHASREAAHRLEPATAGSVGDLLPVDGPSH